MGATTSPSLLLRIRDNEDHESWEQFAKIYSVIIRDYCFQRRLSDSDTDDVLQEVMRKVTSAIKSFDYDPSKGRFRAWLGTVAANTIKSHIAGELRKQNTVAVEADARTLFEQYEDPDSAWVDIYMERIFNAACEQVKSQFSVTTWSCFEGIWIDNKSSSQVASELGIAVHSVYVNKSRVLKRLEAEVRNLAGDLPR